MKINGVKVQGAYEETVVIPRDPDNLVFTARAISSYEDFEKLCPQPKPPVRVYPGNREVEDIENPAYQKKFQEWAELKGAWIVLASLKATEGLEWETVVYGDSSTWSNYEQEMTDAGLSQVEIGRIVKCVSIANGLDQSKIDEATESFLAFRAAQARSENSQDSESSDMPSGEPVSASA